MSNFPIVSVLMPTFRQAPFIVRALRSLIRQTFDDWELIVIDDGSTDATAGILEPWQRDQRVNVIRHSCNLGLGVAANHGLMHARGNLIAYLPSDDVWDTNHLETLVECVRANPDAIVVYSGVRRIYQDPGSVHIVDKTSTGAVDGYPLQLVQVMHGRTSERWTERCELVTDDLTRMFWSKLREHGNFVGTGKVTCEWTDHPKQRHKLIREPLGGINPYRAWYGVRQPLHFHSSVGSPMDEAQHYAPFRACITQKQKNGLKIVIAGALAFHPERIVALANEGHELYGLWAPEDMHWFNTVGPLPFGHVQDVPLQGWEEELKRIKPDVIYGALNYQVVPFVHDVMTRAPEVPFVWHFKEGPFDCIRNGTWPLLVDLCTRSDGQIYSSPEQQRWMELNLPGDAVQRHSMQLDGDLPPRCWFTEDRSPRLSATQGGIHTVVTGQPLGMTPETVEVLARNNIHLHMYGEFYRTRFATLISALRAVAPDHLHVHGQVSPKDWVKELSKYDAGWLHLLRSRNGGDVLSAQWADLNYPARISTLSCAGVPWIQPHPETNIVATAELAKKFDIGIFYRTPQDLARKLHDTVEINRLRETLWHRRDFFTFDHHVKELVAFFEKSIDRHHRRHSHAVGSIRKYKPRSPLAATHKQDLCPGH